jgi:hypothetical protein
VAFGTAAGWIAVLLVVFTLPACRHLERARPARPPRDLPAGLVASLRPRHPGLGLVLSREETGRSHDRYSFHFHAYSEADGDFHRVDGEYYRSLEIPAGARGPLILVSPILAGSADDYLTSRVFCRWACAEGMSAFFLHQAEGILSTRRDGVDLEYLLRESVQDNIRALDLLAGRPEVDAARLGSFAISLGAIKNVLLIAVEPRLAANVLCLAGADLAGILLESREGGVERYVERRLEREGLTREELAEDIRHSVASEPGDMATAIANDRVLLFLGSLDNKVPFANGLLLYERLGRPETHILPLGHYTGVLAAPYAAKRAFRFYRSRFAGPATGVD